MRAQERRKDEREQRNWNIITRQKKRQKIERACETRGGKNEINSEREVNDRKENERTKKIAKHKKN